MVIVMYWLIIPIAAFSRFLIGQLLKRLRRSCGGSNSKMGAAAYCAGDLTGF
ncbi:hypothetical protein PO124_18690 [Bacillus licheniformis]|nr:hypothetical protein [Bacillus licheniformis]